MVALFMLSIFLSKDILTGVGTMNTKTKFCAVVISAAVVGLMVSSPVTASVIECQDATNFMGMDDAYASKCLASGDDNPAFTSNDKNMFLKNPAGEGYTYLDKSEGATDNFEGILDSELGYNQVDNNLGYEDPQWSSYGNWTFDSDLWASYDTIALGFKFGGSNDPDNWFVYEINPNTSQGTWAYSGSGDGLSNISVYGKNPVAVPEPGTLALLGLGVFGLALSRRKARSV